MMSTSDASLYTACIRGDKELVLALATPENVDYVHCVFGDTPLHLACKQGWLDIVKLLIETYGCNSTVTNRYDQSPLDYAKRYGKIELVSYLQSINNSLYWACVQGNIHLVCKLTNPDTVNYVHPVLGDTPLHRACGGGFLDIVKLLIEKYGCDPKVATKSNQSVLHYACRYGHIDIVKYLIDKQHLNPLLRDNNQLEPLDYALNNKADIAVYLCQHCISSGAMLNPSRIKTTINLVKYILRGTSQPVSKWKSANGDNILQLMGSSISRIPSVIVLDLLNSGNAKYILFKPGYKTNDGYNILELACQSEIYLSQTPSGLILKMLYGTTINQVKKSIPDSITADGDTLIQLVCQSEIFISHISTAVLTKWLSDTTLIQNVIKIITPRWKTADDDTLLQLVCQSKACLLRISSAILLNWLHCATLFRVNTSLPDSKTADGDKLLQLVCQSETTVSQISSAVLSMWLRNTYVNLANIIILPEWKTANGDTLLQLVCQSRSTMSRISSKVLTKWLSDSPTTCVLVKKLDTPELRTADGDTLFQLICQSEKCLIQISSITFLKWLRKTPLEFVSVSIPDCKTADGDTLLQLILMSPSKTSSMVSAKLLNDSRDLPINHMKMVDPNWQTLDGTPFFHVLCQLMVEDKRIIELMQHYVLKHGDNTFLDSEGNTALHIACQANNLAVVSYLIDQTHCDPNIKNKNGSFPLDMTTNIEVITYLCQHDHVAVYSKTIVEWMKNVRLIDDATMLCVLKILIENHRFKTRDESTLLHVLCMYSFEHVNTIRFVDFVLTECHCDPNCLDSNEQMPLQVTSDHVIMTKLLEHGAKMTADVVFQLITSESEADYEILTLSARKQGILYPNELNSDGYTALHLACKAGYPTLVNLLLTQAHCDPNIKSNNDEVPLQMTTNTDIIKDLIRYGAKTTIMYVSLKKLLRTDKPVQPPVKVFIVGNPSVGKSTLTAALKKKVGVIARIFSGKVSGVDRKTVGIVPHDLESKIFGRVTLYDFAGHREFYSGHAALLQTAIQSTPPVFLLMVNLCEREDEIIKNILYWISFLENQCASVTCKPHIILVGSHADALIGINPKNKIEVIVDSLNTNCFTNMEYIGFVAMNCQYHESTGMSDLRRLLINSCEELRIHEPITFNAHCFLVFLIDTFMNLTAVTIKTVSEKIENHQSKEGVLEFLPESIETLYKICLELNDRGHILLLKDRFSIENSYIVIDKEFLLSRLSGTVFAPEGFKQHKDLSKNTGVVPLSKIVEIFSDQDLNILIGFLTHLEFCHEISDQALYQLISEQYPQNTGERYYLFPGLISVKADDTVWQMQSEYGYNFGWILKCIHLEQFFSSRFLQVLLLRLAFSFALEIPSDNANQSIGMHRNCYLWKNGIFWGRTFAMQTLVEVSPDNKSVLLLARFQKDDLFHCVHHRSEVISTILQCKEQFCPRVQTTEFFLDSSSPHQYPIYLLNESNSCTLQDLATAVMSDTNGRRVVLQCATIPAKDFLSFEPYLEMKLSTIQELCDETNEKKVVSENCLLSLVQQATDELRPLIKTITGSSTNGIGKEQLYQDLSRWRDSDKTKQKTYKDLRQLVDQYSVFAGRNVLELASKQPKLLRPMDEEEQEKEEKPQCKLTVQGDRPKLHELQLLKLANGTELIRIMEKVTPEWDEVAVALGFDGARIKTMKMGAYYQPGKACLEMFTDWLAGGHDLKPPTWDSLIQSLRAAKLTEIADLLNRTIEIEAEDASASTLTTMAVDSESQVASSTATPDIINGNIKGHAGPSIATVLNVKALEVMEGRRGRKVRIIDSIGSQWEEVAKALAMGQEDIDMIKTTHSDNDKEACREMLAT